MYPETDIPPILVTNEEIENAREKIFQNHGMNLLMELQKKYELNPQLSEQIFDSQLYWII